MRSYYVLLVLAFGLMSSPSFASWHEASTDHFVIYADDGANDLRKYAQNLERYHKAMEVVTGRSIPPPSPSSRVTIYVVGDQRAIQRLRGGDNKNIAGFYRPQAGGSVAFVQNIQSARGYPHISTIVLLHEYAHHFLVSSSRFPMPLWMSEGAAEFFSAATFGEDGSIRIGRPAQHRAYELQKPNQARVVDLMSPNGLEDHPKSFYARSWLLYHYLNFESSRAGQIDQYWREFLSGKSAEEAAIDVFGNLDELDRELDEYRRGSFYSYALSASQVPAGEVEIRRLPRGEARAMPLRILLERGVDDEKAAELVEDAKHLASQYPTNAVVHSLLAQAEYQAGNDQDTVIAADAALSIQPDFKPAYVSKALALFRLAKDSAEPEAAYSSAMSAFSKLNSLENNHPLPLIYLYYSFTVQGKNPDELAKSALLRAAELAPFDRRLAMEVAAMHLRDGEFGEALKAIQPVAADPHAGPSAFAARDLIRILANRSSGNLPVVVVPIQ